MESTGEPRRVQCSGATAALLSGTGRHTLTRRGENDVKGKAKMETFWLTSRARGKSAARGGSHRTSSLTSSSAAAAVMAEVAEEEAAARAASTAAAAAPAAAGDGSVRVAIDEPQPR
jgi:hypothetical protein